MLNEIKIPLAVLQQKRILQVICPLQNGHFTVNIPQRHVSISFISANGTFESTVATQPRPIELYFLERGERKHLYRHPVNMSALFFCVSNSKRIPAISEKVEPLGRLKMGESPLFTGPFLENRWWFLILSGVDWNCEINCVPLPTSGLIILKGLTVRCSHGESLWAAFVCVFLIRVHYFGEIYAGFF